MLVAGRARCRFNIGERLIAHVAAGGRGDEISGDRCEQGERFLSSEIAVGMTVHHIVDAFMPYRRARRCVVTSAIGFLRWLESWFRQPYHQDDKCHGKDETYRDNDAQPRFDMNRVQCVEIVAETRRCDSCFASQGERGRCFELIACEAR